MSVGACGKAPFAGYVILFCAVIILSLQGGPFVAGKEFTAVDAKLAPALYHIQTALAHYKNWSIPAEYTHVLKYIEVRIVLYTMKGMNSMQSTITCYSTARYA